MLGAPTGPKTSRIKVKCNLDLLQHIKDHLEFITADAAGDEQRAGYIVFFNFLNLGKENMWKDTN